MRDQELWKRHGVKPDDEWSSIIFARVFRTETGAGGKEKRTLVGYIFVIEPNRPDPRFKMPGGHKKPGHTPLITAMAEFEGETGLRVSSGSMQYVNSEWRHRPSPHWSCLFVADVAVEDIHWTRNDHPDNEGEIPKFLTVDEFWNEVCANRFLVPHYSRLFSAGLILFFGRDKPETQ